jgi:hypothetical protein
MPLVGLNGLIPVSKMSGYTEQEILGKTQIYFKDQILIRKQWPTMSSQIAKGLTVRLSITSKIKKSIKSEFKVRPCMIKNGVVKFY